MSPVAVTASSRLHFGLMDLSGATSRTFGGMGAMLAFPKTRVHAEPATGVRVVGQNLSAVTATRIAARLRILCEQAREPGILVEVVESPPVHVGLGSGTSITLASLTAANIVLDLGLTDPALQILSGRGGASGIGVHGFFRGGIIVDAGQRGQVPILPSSLQNLPRVSTMVQALHAPADWVVTLFQAPGKRVFNLGEAEMFERASAVDKGQVREQLAIMYHGMVPAVIEGDLFALGESLTRFASLGLKAHEIASQSADVRSCLQILRETAPCAGMSSFGPTVFAVSGGHLGRVSGLPAGTVVTESRFASSGWSYDVG